MAYQSQRGLGIQLDPNDAQPLYRQIATALRDRISAGVLPPGFRLPPTRRLAEQLDTHRNTVVRAFEELGAAGWVTSVVGRGTFVSEPAARPAAPPARAAATRSAQAAPFPWRSLLSSAATAEPLARYERLARNPAGGDVINLTRMQPSQELLPHERLRRCIDHVLKTRRAEALGYAPRQGLERLRVAIAADLNASAVPASPDEILITTGSQQAIDLIARLLVDPGDSFVTEGRTYSGALNALTAAGAQVIGVPCDDDGPDLDALEAVAVQRVKGLYAMPNSRNPTGTTMSTARREALVDWSVRFGVPIVEDDYGADLNLSGVPSPPALRALSPHVFYIGTFSKKLIPALRVGFVVCPAPVLRDLVALKHAMDLGTSALLQHALAEFLERGYLRAHLRETLPVYRARRDALAGALRAHLPEGAHFRVPDHGVVQWVSLPEGVDPEALFEEAKRSGVLVSPSTLYAASGPAAAAGVRIAFCAEPIDRLVEGAKRLSTALRAVMARRRSAASSPLSQTIELI